MYSLDRQKKCKKSLKGNVPTMMIVPSPGVIIGNLFFCFSKFFYTSQISFFNKKIKPKKVRNILNPPQMFFFLKTVSNIK